MCSVLLCFCFAFLALLCCASAFAAAFAFALLCFALALLCFCSGLPYLAFVFAFALPFFCFDLLCSALLLLCLLLLLVWLVLVALGCLLAGLGPVLAALGALLAALGLLLGRSWALLGGSWEALGRLLAALGAILEKHQKINQKTMPKMTDFGSQKGAQREPKSNPKPTKIEDKNRCEKRTEPKPSWNRFGAILGRFGSPLGVIFIDFSLVFKAFPENSRFSKNSVSRAVLSPTWAILGRFWPPKRLQDELQKRTKTIKKRC